MKIKKWLTYTLGILLTLVILAAVGGAGFRIGMMQNTSFTRPSFTQNFDRGSQAMQPQAMQGIFHGNDGPKGMQDNSQNKGFNYRGNDRRGGMPFFSPIFALIRLAVLGLLLWIGYKLVQKSGWRLTRVAASPASVASETDSVGEKKEEA